MNEEEQAAVAEAVRAADEALERTEPRASNIVAINRSARVEEWDDATPLPGLPDAPAWSDDLLPEVFRPWLTDINDRLQCPPEYTAVAAIVPAASLIGRECAIRPKRADDWTVVPNLYGLQVGPPSWMKSPSVRETLRPIRALQLEYAEAFEAAEVERLAIGAQLDAAKTKMAAAAKRDEDLAQSKADLATIMEQVKAQSIERRLIVNDATVEALGEKLRDNPRGLLLFRDEISGFLRTLNRQGHENERSLYLEAWNGDGSYQFDRIKRGTVNIPSLCMSILGTIQPGPLSNYLHAASENGAGADGLIQRFQLMVYPHLSGKWHNVDRAPDLEAKDAAAAVFRRLAESKSEDFGARVDGARDIPSLRFEDAAQTYFDEWREVLENRCRSGEEHPVFEAHLIKYRSLFPSLALVFHLIDHGSGDVGLDSAHRASDWCDLLEGHAQRVYASVSSAGITSAALLLAKIRAGKVGHPFRARDIYLRGWSGLSDRESVAAAITMLEDTGWVRRKTTPTKGRPRQEVQLHPSLRPESP